MTAATVTLIGNEGFRIATGGRDVYIDAFYDPIYGVAGRPRSGKEDITKADLILVTHCHGDHFNPGRVAEAASRTGATVIGPATVIRSLRGKLPPAALVEMEPPTPGGRSAARPVKVQLPAATVTALRTFHSHDHNSYLIEIGGFRAFHDGDNEDTTRIDASALGRLDALLIGPWQGSGWVRFIETLCPARWFIMHLTDEELDELEAGRFLPEICDHVPPNLVVLRPGQSFEFP